MTNAEKSPPVAKASFQMIITVTSLNLHRISELAEADHPGLEMRRGDGGLYVAKGPHRAFFPESVIAVLEFR